MGKELTLEMKALYCAIRAGLVLKNPFTGVYNTGKFQKFWKTLEPEIQLELAQTLKKEFPIIQEILKLCQDGEQERNN